MPPYAKENVRPNLWSLSQESAGLSIKFKTNASKVSVRYKVTGSLSMPHMPTTGVSGIDMYYVNKNRDYLWCEGRYSFNDTIYYQYDNINSSSELMNEFQLFLPLYNKVDWVEIGINENDKIDFIPIDNSDSNIVVYGTSIAQGACASRPGMAWTNIITRNLDQSVINLGFSGNGKLETELFELLSEIDNASLFIIDCMPNMHSNVDEINKRIKDGVKMLRKKSDTPILLVEHCGYNGSEVSDTRKEDFNRTNIELKRAYNELTKENIANIHYLSYEDINLTNDSQVDGVHASDLGMQQYATAYEKKINDILRKTTD